ncbi:hypothetical protein M5E87_20295 [Flavonifractor plautii]|nr:hypothetical protein M5E87_20295 [Flavonifractor plautii]
MDGLDGYARNQVQLVDKPVDDVNSAVHHSLQDVENPHFHVTQEILDACGHGLNFQSQLVKQIHDEVYACEEACLYGIPGEEQRIHHREPRNL